MRRFNNIVYPNLVINAQYQQMRVAIPVAVDGGVPRTGANVALQDNSGW